MSEPYASPLIVALCKDLLFTSRIESVAGRLDFHLHVIESIDQYNRQQTNLPERQYAEHLVGPGAELLDQITSWQPAMILVDMNNKDLPWRSWTALLKSAPATRRIPLVCFGAHMDVEAMRSAKDAGADAVLSRSRFISSLPELIQKYARIPDRDGIDAACQGELSELAIEGLELFNKGEYFEAHEVLEDAWNEDATPGRELYRAILQVAVAYLQIERRNYNGAVKMFLRLRQWIDPLPDLCRGVDVGRLRQDARHVEKHLLALGSQGVEMFDHSLFQPVRFLDHR